MLVVLFGIELLLLFFLSRRFTQLLSLVLQCIHLKQKGTVLVIALFFLPGTVIHELSHWLMAKLLFVRTGKISLFPYQQGTTIRMGSVAVAKTDILRQLLIGVAPFLSGITILFFTFYFFIPHLLSFNNWTLGAGVYILFVMTNSMFSSKKDIEGAGWLIAGGTIIAIFFYVLNTQTFLKEIVSLISLIPQQYVLFALYALAIPLLIDVLIVVALQLIIHFMFFRRYVD